MQRRNARTNVTIAAFPALVCVLLAATQSAVDGELGRPPFRCGCGETGCGVRYSTPVQALTCAERSLARWPALVQVPGTEARALTHVHPRRCGASENCPAAVLLTGQNRHLAEGLGRALFPRVPVEYYLVPGASNYLDYSEWFSRVVLGSSTLPARVLFMEPALVPDETLYVLQDLCLWNSSRLSVMSDGMPLQYGYDFIDTSMRGLQVYIWYNSTFSRDDEDDSMTVLRVPRLVNMTFGFPPSEFYFQCKVVKQLLEKMDMRSMFICHNLKTVYAGKNGNPDKIAVRVLSLALRKGQCFGMLGPSGSGKTSFINMVVYMDELSTGLDPMSRIDLWNVIKQAKKDYTIILTTHSMEEAEELCDRIGIFIDGEFHCIGTPNELKARYGGTRTLTIMTDPKHKGEVDKLVNQLSPSTYRFYSMSGTQKFVLPHREVGLDDVFRVVETLRRAFPVLGWGLTDATLEDVFIRVVKEAQAIDDMS
ncbi:unnamed protein product [Urochloa decumbens]|uniref:ABC transporter domain-containing protein n=1 Tax=Urochloa decumbens TaxID=240449 RepID=A0ABC9BRM0_9POAL